MESTQYTPLLDIPGNEPVDLFVNAEKIRKIQQEDFELEDVPSINKDECDNTYWLEGREWQGITVVMLVTAMLLLAFFSF